MERGELARSLSTALAFLLADATGHDYYDRIATTDAWHQLQVLRSLLCERHPLPPLPADVMDAVDRLTLYQQAHRVQVSTTSIPPRYCIPASPRVRISRWRGDITTLTDVTAIVNAANKQLLGCFQPQHRCIDNVIHSAAGPRLRSACNELMAAQDHRPEPNGHAKLTPGYALSAQWVLHTVGPQLRPRQEPSEREKDYLRSCYLSCLDAVEKLPPLPDGRLVIAFPCISTGLFCFPADLAARIAVAAVESWCASHPTTTLTDVIFDVFSDADEQHYESALAEALNSGHLAKCAQDAAPAPVRSSLSSSLRTARDWLEHPDYIVISAGAGLSAATGLDYTSTDLFRTHFPAFIPLGLRRLYDVFGYAGWPSPGHKWGYYFKHLNMVRSWPSSLLYTSLLSFVTARFGDDHFFVRTSNADGLFVANGFPEDRVSTPQGAYKYLQCMRNCRPDAFFPSAPFLAAALPHLDPVTQVLTDTSKIPRCTYCGSELFLCVRAGNWFNELPYAEGEARYRNFLERAEQEGASLVILELGVGMNTPSVLRWPNEDLARDGGGRVKLVRVGKEAAHCEPVTGWKPSGNSTGLRCNAVQTPYHFPLPGRNFFGKVSGNSGM